MDSFLSTSDYQTQISPNTLVDGSVSVELFYSSRGHNSSKNNGMFTLMCAVLDDALRCLQKRSSSNASARREAQEVLDWFLADDPHWPFSFVNICVTLGVDPDYAGQRLKTGQFFSSPLYPLKRKLCGEVRRPHLQTRRSYA